MKDTEDQNVTDREETVSAVSIDCILFAFHQGHLQIPIVKHAAGISQGKWALPGGFIRTMESIDHAANRLLLGITGLRDIYLEQLKAFGEPERYPAARTITIAYLALIKNTPLIPGFTASEARWCSIEDVPELIYDHHDILQYGIEHLRLRVKHEPIGFNLLPEKFTLLELQGLYEAILGLKLDKPNFRRKILRMNLLVPLNEKQQDVSHRAAGLYRFDPKTYERLKETGFKFEY